MIHLDFRWKVRLLLFFGIRLHQKTSESLRFIHSYRYVFWLDLICSVMCDASLMLGKSFRVGWGPGWSFVHSGQKCEPESSDDSDPQLVGSFGDRSSTFTLFSTEKRKKWVTDPWRRPVINVFMTTNPCRCLGTVGPVSCKNTWFADCKRKGEIIVGCTLSVKPRVWLAFVYGRF